LGEQDNQLTGLMLWQWNFFLWGYLKTRVYETCLATILDLEQWSWQCIEAIPNEMLQHVMTFLPGQVQECGRGDGGYLKNIVFKYCLL
jgi:hypothetical protein